MFPGWNQLCKKTRLIQLFHILNLRMLGLHETGEHYVLKPEQWWHAETICTFVLVRGPVWPTNSPTKSVRWTSTTLSVVSTPIECNNLARILATIVLPAHHIKALVMNSYHRLEALNSWCRCPRKLLHEPAIIVALQRLGNGSSNSHNTVKEISIVSTAMVVCLISSFFRRAKDFLPKTARVHVIL